MKKILYLICACAVLLAGCNKQPVYEVPPTQASTTNATEVLSPSYVPQQETMYAVSIPAETNNLYAEDGTMIYSHTHQSMLLTHPDPDVAQKVIIDFLSRIQENHTEADTYLNVAKADYKGSSDWTPYLYNITYNPTRIDQSVLSLFGNRVAYNGGSHPERLCVSVSYDLVTGDVLTLGSIMSAQATPQDFCFLVLEQLSQIADEKYLYAGYEEIVKNRFAGDESLDEDWYFSSTGLCFYFEPYQIAPYSSGAIAVEIPYTALAGLLYDGYFPAERESGTGTVHVTASDQFSQIAELVMDTDGEMIFLFTEGIVWDVQIEYGAWDTEMTNFTHVYTAVYSSTLTPGDAIMLQTKEPGNFRISYFDGTYTVTRSLTKTEAGIILEA